MKNKLFLGVARTNITPEVGCQLYGYNPNVFSESVHDELTAIAFYFKSGDTEALMMSLSVCSLKTELSDDIVSMIEEKYSIPKGNQIIHCIHTHSGPNVQGSEGWGDIDKEYYEEIFLPNVMKVVGEAMKAPVPVKMGFAVGESYIGVNRRQLTVENNVKLGQNPWAPFDPKMMVISFADESGNVVANIVHYGMHGTCAGGNVEISRDWAGVMVDELENVSGAITAFFNGAEGDVGPRLTNGKTAAGEGGDIKFAERHGALAAQDAVKIYRNIASYNDVSLSVFSGSINIPLEKRIDLESAIEGYEKYKDYKINYKAAAARYYRTQIELYENGYVDKETREIPQTIMRIGEVAFVSFPYELFSEIAMRIACERKVPYTLSLSNTNGSEGYFVTEDQICRGGYEVNMFKTGYIQPYVNNADWYLVKETLENLDKLNKGE